VPQIVYECLFILDSNKYARDAAGTAANVNGMITKHGGEVIVSRLWNEQKLAYAIDGHRKGTYWLTYFKLDSQKIVEFRRTVQLNEVVVRSLVIKPPQKLTEVLIQHALSGPVPPKPPEPGEDRRRGRSAPVAVEVPDEELNPL